jgi:hypothetical protein
MVTVNYSDYFNSINEFVLYIQALIIDSDYKDNVTKTVKWCLDNLGTVVFTKNTGWINVINNYHIKSDKDEFTELQKTYTSEEVIETLNAPINMISMFKKFQKFNLFEKKGCNLVYKPDDAEFVNGLVTSRFVKMDINDIDLTYDVMKINGIKSFIEYSIIMQHVKKSITGIITDTCAENEKFMYNLLNFHNDMNQNICEELKLDHPPFSLKGGNVFKLIKRNVIIKDGIDLKHDDLSDWDFVVNMKHNENFKKSEKEFFNQILTNDVDKIYYDNIKEIHDNCDKIYAESVFIWNFLKKGLNNIRNNIDITVINELINFKIQCILSGSLMYKYSINVTADNSDDIIDIYGTKDNVIRNQNLNRIKGISEFKKYMGIIPFKEQTKVQNPTTKNIRILDMELYNIIKTPNRDKGKSTIFGFDLMRLGLMYNISFNIGDIKLSFKSNAELLDYGLAKPYTIGSYLHGDKNSDFSNINYLPKYENKFLTGKIITVNSYNLYWFINDIIYIIKTNPRQPKHEKRLLRVAESLSILYLEDSQKLIQWLKKPSYYEYNTKTNGQILVEEFENKKNRLSYPDQVSTYSVSIPIKDRDNAVSLILGIIGGNNTKIYYNIKLQHIALICILIIFIISFIYILSLCKSRKNIDIIPRKITTCI